MPLNLLEEEFSMTPIKIRKLLITAGAYHTPTSDLVHALFKNGKNAKEIKAITGLSEASISGYLPYIYCRTNSKMMLIVPVKSV